MGHCDGKGLRVLWLVTVLSALVAMPARADDGRVELRGRLVDAIGEPVRATVEVHPLVNPRRLAEQQLAGQDSKPLARSRSGADGRYRLELAPGAYSLLVRSPRHLSARYDLGPLLGGQELPDLTLWDRQQMRLRVVDRRGERLLGLEMVGRAWSHDWRRSAAQGWWPHERWLATDDRGRAVLPCAEGERITLVAATEAAIHHHVVDCRPGEVLQLAPNARWVPVSLDTAGLGVQGALLGFYRWPLVAFAKSDAEGMLWLPVGDSETIPLWLADDLGSFGSPEVRQDPTADPSEPPGQSDGVAPGPSDGAVLEPSDGAADPGGAKGTLIFEMPRSVFVEGRVVDRSSGRPLDGAWVWLGRGAHHFQRTDATGRFRMRLPADDEDPLRVGAVGYAEHRGPMPAELDDGEVLEIRLEPSVSLVGTLVDPFGEPITDGAVELLPADDDPRAVRRSRSDSDGAFRLTGLEPGRPYTLVASAHGFREYREAWVIEGMGEHTLELQPARRVFGRVLGVDEEPLPKARVELFKALGGEDRTMLGHGGESLVVECAEDGYFEYFDPPPGTYVLAARALDVPEVQIPGLEIPEDDEDQDLGTVVIPPGIELEGRLLDVSEEPVVGARLSLRRTDGGRVETRRAGSVWFANTVSTTDGTFVFRGLPSFTRLTLLAIPEAPFLPKQEAVVLEGESRWLDLPMVRGAMITGTVVDSGGTPVVGARVRADPQGPSNAVNLNRKLQESTRDPDGAFELGPLAPGTYGLHAWIDDRESSPEIIDTRATDSRGLTLVLEPQGQLFGKVVDPEGRPVSRAFLVLRPRSDGGGPARRNAGFSNSEGGFRIQPVRPGSYRLEAQHPDFEPVDLDLELPGTEAFQQVVRFEHWKALEEGAFVTGLVVDASGFPVADADVWTLGKPWRRVSSGSDGTFEVEAPVGSMRILAKHPEAGGHAGLELDVPAEGLTGVTLALDQPSGSLVGRVQGLDLDSLARLEVVAWGGSDLHYGVVEWNGDFRIEGLVPGIWTVTARLSDPSRSVRQSVEVEPHSETVLDLAFEPGFRLSGQALRSGEPLAGGLVSVRCPGGTEAFAVADGEGRFLLEGLADESCTVTLQDSANGDQIQQPVDVGSTVDLWLEIEP